MRIALSGDMKAYRELYLLMFDKLFKFSFSFVKSKEAAEELVSDVFMKIWSIRDQLSTIQDLKIYLYCITRNLSLNYLAKEKKLIDRLDQNNIDLLTDFNTPEDKYISKETIDGLKQAIEGLPPQCRIIFLLVRDQDMKYKDVAHVLNISVFTVRNQVAIATKKISEALPSHLQFLLHFQDRFSES